MTKNFKKSTNLVNKFVQQKVNKFVEINKFVQVNELRHHKFVDTSSLKKDKQPDTLRF